MPFGTPFSPSALQARLAGEAASPGVLGAAREASRVAEEVREELAVLRECIVACGLLSNQRLQAEAHKRRFRAAAGRSSGWGGVLGAAFEDLSEGPLTAIAAFLGPDTGLPFRCVSPPVEANCLKAASMYGPRFYLWGGFTGEVNQSAGATLDLAAGEWQPLPPMPDNRSGGACSTVDGKIYVAGGFDSKANLSSANRFDPVALQWEALPDMTERRFGCSGADFGGSFCVCGGNDGQKRLDTVECFLPKSGKWQLLPSMTAQRIGAVAAALGGRLFACGGQDLSSAECFNQGRWARLPPMTVKRFGASGGACGGCVYVAGGKGKGMTNLNSVERFSPELGHWEVVAKMATSRFASVASCVQGRLYVFGGFEAGSLLFGGTRLTSVECYCPEENEWEELTPLPEGRSGAFVSALVWQAGLPGC